MGLIRPAISGGLAAINSLVGGFNPFEKYARRIGPFHQIEMNIEKYLKPPPGYG